VYQADNDGQKMHPLPNNVLNASELYSIVTSDKPTFTSIPMGQKNNCYMLLDISTNVERKKSNKKSQFSDDLGSWNSDYLSGLFSFQLLCSVLVYVMMGSFVRSVVLFGIAMGTFHLFNNTDVLYYGPC
jgi:hypothetical protein